MIIWKVQILHKKDQILDNKNVKMYGKVYNLQKKVCKIKKVLMWLQYASVREGKEKNK